MFSIMLCMFFGFLGILLVLFFMLRNGEQQYRALRDELDKTQALLLALEARLNLPNAADEGEDPFLKMTDEKSAFPEQGGFDPALDLHFDPAAGQDSDGRHGQ
ncbi:hypothetical protein AGMMS49974_05600 [Deltaproteobacteria bacterium]|nr:hypothetical protein AGMMS49974_05600 [Deltaproteobacteria bacterium]